MTDDIRRELARQSERALAAFAAELDARGATAEQKDEALGFLRAELEANAAAWHAGTANQSTTKH